MPVWARPLKVEEALSLAMKQNAELRAALAETRELRAQWGQSGSLPNGSFSFGMTRGQGAASLNNSSGLPRDEFVQFTQNFHPIGSLAKSEQVGLLKLQEGEWRLRTAQMRLLRQTKDAFYTLMAAQMRLKVLQTNLDLAREGSRLADLRLKQGKGERSDVLAARVQVNQVQQQLVQTEGELLSDRATLAPLLGLPPDAPIVAEGKLETDYEKLTLAEVVQLGQNSPQLQAAQRALMAAEEQVKLAALQGNPSPGVFALYDFRIPSYLVGAQLSMPLDWGEIGYEMEARQAAAEAQKARLEGLQLSLLSDIHKAHAAFVAGVKNSDSYEEEVLIPQEEAVRLTSLELEQKKLDYDQFLLAQTQLEIIRVEFLRQVLVERLALNALEEAVGTPLEPLDLPEFRP